MRAPSARRTLACAVALALAACTPPRPPPPAPPPLPTMPAANPWLTDSVYPTARLNAGATSSVGFAGLATGKPLQRDRDVKVIWTVMTSSPVAKRIGDDTVLFANGPFGIRKILASRKTFERSWFTPFAGTDAVAHTAAEADAAELMRAVDRARRVQDDARIAKAIGGLERLGVDPHAPLGGAGALFDRDGFHYCVHGKTTLVKSTDDGLVRGPVRIDESVDVAAALPRKARKAVPRVTALAMTYDGHLAAVAPGGLVVLDRDLHVKASLFLPGETMAPGLAIDERNGIYVVTSRRVRRVVWNGATLSTNEPDGAWESAYDGATEAQEPATGTVASLPTAPTLMGFGADPDKLVVIADAAAAGPNVVAFWREEIPAAFVQKPGTASRRIADQARVTAVARTPTRAPVVLGYGVAVANDAYPEPADGGAAASAFTAGVTRAAPRGIQKLAWDPASDRFTEAWINADVDNADRAVPVVSAQSNLLYAASKERGDYQYVGLDWTTGAIRERWSFPDDSRLWNAFGGITALLEDGDLLIGGAFAIKRVLGH